MSTASASEIRLIVHGAPAPQGSKRAVRTKNGKINLLESSAKVRPWREAVKQAALDVIGRNNDWKPWDAPILLDATFYFLRPQSHYRSGRNAHLLKVNAPVRPTSPPDLSKLVRSTEDALTEAGLWRDDSRVADLYVSKVYVGDAQAVGLSSPGAVITIRRLP